MFKNIFGWPLVLISLILPACRGRLNQDFQAIERDCGASWVQQHPNHTFYPIVTENGEEPGDLRVAWLSPESKIAVDLKVGPRHCVAIPPTQGTGLILVARPETGAMNAFPNTPGWKHSLKLTPKTDLKIDLSCPRGGIFARSQASVAVTFSLDQKALTRENAAKILRLYSVTVKFKEGETEVAAYSLADFERLAEPAALKLLQDDPNSTATTTTAPITHLFTRQGSYHATLEWKNFLGQGNDSPNSPSLCPIEIDSEAPATPLLTVATIGDAPFLTVGARLPLFVGKDELHFHVDRIAAQQLYRKWSSLSAQEQAAQPFEVGTLPTMDRSGIYRLRAYAEDKAGNRSEVFEQILNVLEPYAVYQSLPDGWQILSLEANKRSLMVGPHWNGKAYMLAWAELQGSTPQKIQTTDQVITPYPKLLKGWQTVQSVKGFFGFGDNQSEQICFYQPTRIGEGTLGRMQCLGWQDGRWQTLAEQVAPHNDNEILIAADVDMDKTTDILAQDVSIGLIRTLAFRKGVLVPTPDFSAGNLGTYGASAGRVIMPIAKNATSAPLNLFLSVAPNSDVACYSADLNTRSINFSFSGLILGAFNNSGHGLPSPVADPGYYFPLLQTFNFRQSIGSDMGDGHLTKLYNWSDEGHKLIAWHFDDCIRTYTSEPLTGLPDLTGRRLQMFRTGDTFRALVFPLNNVLAEPFEIYRLNGQSWSIETLVENPSSGDQTKPETDDPKLNSSPNRLDAGWYDFSDGSRSWGGASVKQGDELPFAARPGYTLFYRWTALQAGKNPTGGPYLQGPLPYPQELGTFLLEIITKKLSEAAPAAADAPDLRRIVGVLPPITTTRGALPDLGILMQVKPGEPLSRIQPGISPGSGVLQWTVQTIEEKSQTSTFKLDQPWAFKSGFFTHQNLTAVVGRFGFEPGNQESICYIRKASLAFADQGRMACLGWDGEKWKWIIEDLAIDVAINQEVQTIDLAEPGLGVTTHLMTTALDSKAVRIATWNPTLTNFEFGPINVQTRSEGQLWPYDEGITLNANPYAFDSAPYPIVMHSLDSEAEDTILTGYPYDPDSTYDGSLYLASTLKHSEANFTLSGSLYVEQWGWIRPYPSIWYDAQFSGGQLTYGRRYLHSQMLQSPLPGVSSVFRLGLWEDFSATLYYSKDPTVCLKLSVPCLINKGTAERNLTFVNGNRDIMTMAMKAYRGADGQTQQILAITPPDVDEGYHFHRWTCEDKVCSWKKILTLRSEGNDR